MAKKKVVVKKPVKKANRLTKSLVKALEVTKREPVWQGPCDDGPQGGITQSLLSLFMVCRERFRLRVVDGLGPPDQFNHRIEYGNMWHLCEEYAHQMRPTGEPLKTYCQKLCRKYPLSQRQIVHWMRVCETQFPVYLGYWSKNADEKRRKPYAQEQAFNVPYHLPSGRVVRLRGKWDGVSQYGKRFYLDEHKTKGEVNPDQIRRQMNFDLQTMLYLTALRLSDVVPSSKVAGVRYNVVLRPLSGGKHSIVQGKGTNGRKCNKCKGSRLDKDGFPCTKCEGVGRLDIKPPESDDEFYRRLSGLIVSEPEHYFHRWVVDITTSDVDRFCSQFLTPILEQLCDWWEWICAMPDDPFDCQTQHADGYAIHWRTPYGFYNVLGEGGTTDMDEYLATGSEVGLERGRPLFQELTEE